MSAELGQVYEELLQDGRIQLSMIVVRVKPRSWRLLSLTEELDRGLFTVDTSYLFSKYCTRVL